MKCLHGLFACLSLAAAAPFAAADFITSGNTTGLPTFNRPFSLTGLSGTGTAVNYQAFPFTVLTSGNYTAEAAATGGAFDTYLLVYGNSFNPAMPLVNLINGDDDFGGSFLILPGSGSGVDSQITLGGGGNFAAGGLPLVTGVSYIAVVTGFANGDAGAFSLGVGDGPGGGTAVLGTLDSPVPVPPTVIAFAIGSLGLAGVRRFRRA